MAEAAIRYVEIEFKIQFTDYKGASLSLSHVFFLGKARRHLLQYKEFLLIQMAFNMFGWASRIIVDLRIKIVVVFKYKSIISEQ
jgi:hypothetical protein